MAGSARCEMCNLVRSWGRSLVQSAHRPATLLVFLPLLACAGGADIWLEGRTLDFQADGWADDASPATSAAEYQADASASDDLWAQDSLTTAYSDPPRPGRLSGGVSAEPTDTVRADVPVYATARSHSQVTVPMEVRRGGRVELEILLELSDVELSNAGVPRVAVSGAIEAADGGPVAGGDLGVLQLEILPDGTIVLGDLGDETAMLDVPGRFSRVLRGPVGGVELASGRYRVTMELSLEATAPARSGPGQLARIGQARATLRVP